MANQRSLSPQYINVGFVAVTSAVQEGLGWNLKHIYRILRTMEA